MWIGGGAGGMSAYREFPKCSKCFVFYVFFDLGPREVLKNDPLARGFIFPKYGSVATTLVSEMTHFQCSHQARHVIYIYIYIYMT